MEREDESGVNPKRAVTFNGDIAEATILVEALSHYLSTEVGPDDGGPAFTRTRKLLDDISTPHIVEAKEPLKKTRSWRVPEGGL